MGVRDNFVEHILGIQDHIGFMGIGLNLKFKVEVEVILWSQLSDSGMFLYLICFAPEQQVIQR